MKKFRMQNFIVHIPHSSIIFPENLTERENEVGFYTDEALVREAIFEADYMIELFAAQSCVHIIKFPFSRMFCDVERFWDNAQEPMSKFGMGAVYTKDSNGKPLGDERCSEQYKENIRVLYYQPHHDNLNLCSTEILNQYGTCYIIDLHSFSDEFVYKLFKQSNTPDICIGYDQQNFDEKFLKMTVEHFKKYGYSVQINYPYQGSIVPNKYYNKRQPGLSSIMIEINKRIYLDYDLVLNVEKYIKLKRCMDDFYGTAMLSL